MLSHAALSQPVRKFLHEPTHVSAPLSLPYRLSSKPSVIPVPERPAGCETRLLRSPFLSAESLDNLLALQKMDAFRTRNSNPSHLLDHARNGGVPLATRRYRSCAVVGSSSTLLDKAQGHLIDAAELVFRLSKPPMPSHLKAYTGTRTDVFMDPWFSRRPRSELCPSGDFDSAGRCLGGKEDQEIFICNGAMFPGCLRHRAPPEARNNNWDRLSPALLMYARNLVHGPDHPACGFCRLRPSSGVVAILLALHRCDVTTIYGFGISPTQPCAKFYSNPEDENCQTQTYYNDAWHNMPLEHAFLRYITKNHTENSLTCHVLPKA